MNSFMPLIVTASEIPSALTAFLGLLPRGLAANQESASAMTTAAVVSTSNWFGRAFLLVRLEWVGGINQSADHPLVGDTGPAAAGHGPSGRKGRSPSRSQDGGSWSGGPPGCGPWAATAQVKIRVRARVTRRTNREKIRAFIGLFPSSA